MSHLSPLKYREVIGCLRANGFIFDRPAKGSHEIWYNPTTRRRTTVPHHPGTLALGTLRAIIKQSGLTVDQFLGR